MKFLLVVVGLAIAVVAEENIISNYHEEIGIPLAARIKRAEQAQDLVGSRIVEGQTASVGDFPYLGGLLIDLTNGYQSVCGSSLLTNTTAVTAAHCWYDGRNQGKSLTIVLGSITLYSGGTRVKTTDVEVHENWNPRNLKNDIALLKISAIEFTDNIKPIAMATSSDDFAGMIGTVSGFGKTGRNVAIKNNQVLRYVKMPIITNAECKQPFGKYVTETNICTKVVDHKATCNGDSGGPLTVDINETSVLAGIVSFGGRNCENGYKALTSVPSFFTWIKTRL